MFCGYGRAIGKQPTPGKVDEKINQFIENLPPETDKIKVFGSGSFLDEDQIPSESRRNFIEKLKQKDITDVVIESRPEHITQKKLGEFSPLDLTVAIGLETAIPRLLEEINKGFTLEDYEEAVQKIHSQGFKARTYLLVNIPGDPDIEKNLKKSVDYALNHSDSVVLINLLPHGDTPLFHKWINGEWTFLSRNQFEEITEPYKGHPRIELDFETFRFTPKFPQEMKKLLEGVGERYLTHPYYEAWFDYLTRFYKPGEYQNILFLPCSYVKPYGKSKTHRAIIKKLKEKNVRDETHEVMLSSAGVIPREFENRYPFNAYDWDERRETPEIKKRYIQVTRERLKEYMEGHRDRYEDIYCYLKYSSESYKALEKAMDDMDLKFKNLLEKETEKDNPEIKLYEQNAIQDLCENLKWLTQNSM